MPADPAVGPFDALGSLCNLRTLARVGPTPCRQAPGVESGFVRVTPGGRRGVRQQERYAGAAAGLGFECALTAQLSRSFFDSQQARALRVARIEPAAVVLDLHADLRSLLPHGDMRNGGLGVERGVVLLAII
jgi:hypothetical protein